MKVGAQPSARCASISRRPAARVSAAPPNQFGMDEVDRADVERRRRAHPAAFGDEPLDEIEADLAVMQAAVDMGLGNLDEAGRLDRLAEARQKPIAKATAAPCPPFAMSCSKAVRRMRTPRAVARKPRRQGPETWNIVRSAAPAVAVASTKSQRTDQNGLGKPRSFACAGSSIRSKSAIRLSFTPKTASSSR